MGLDLAVAYAAAMSLFVTVLAGSEALPGELKPLTMSHPASSISYTAMGAARKAETGVNGGTMANIAREAAGQGVLEVRGPRDLPGTRGRGRQSRLGPLRVHGLRRGRSACTI